MNAVAGPSTSSAPPIATTSIQLSPLQPLSDLSDADADHDGGDGEHDQLDQSDDEESSSVLGSDLLDPPKWVKYTTKHLYDLMVQGEIDLEPPYQRALVWTTPKQIKLIDSLFRNFYIPPVVFAVHHDHDGGAMKVCVDGQQRLRSIFHFLDGHIPYRNEMTKKKWWWKSGIRPESRKILPREEKQAFEKIEIYCVEYKQLDQTTEREIFQRVQLGVALTAAEKIQAVSSPWSEWITSLKNKHIHIDNGLSVLLSWDTSRARDFQNIAHFVYCCDKFATSTSAPTLPSIPHSNSTSKSKPKSHASTTKSKTLPSSARKREVPTAQKIQRWLERTDEPTRVFKRDIDDVLCFMTEVASGGDGNGGRRRGRRLVNGFEMEGKRVAPVEFVFIGVLLYVTRDIEDDEWRALSILNLRKRVRENHTDIRTNTACARTFWKFIEGIEEEIERSKHPQPRHQVPTSAFASASTSTSASKAKAKAKAKTIPYEGMVVSQSKPSQSQSQPQFQSQTKTSPTTTTVVFRTQHIPIPQTPKQTQKQKQKQVQLPTPTSTLKRKRAARDEDDLDGGRDGDGDVDMDGGGDDDDDDDDDDGGGGGGGGGVGGVGGGVDDGEPPIYFDPNRAMTTEDTRRLRNRRILSSWPKRSRY